MAQCELVLPWTFVRHCDWEVKLPFLPSYIDDVGCHDGRRLCYLTQVRAFVWPVGSGVFAAGTVFQCLCARCGKERCVDESVGAVNYQFFPEQLPRILPDEFDMPIRCQEVEGTSLENRLLPCWATSFFLCGKCNHDGGIIRKQR